ncbi:MAG: zinc ribbon domain-containing protein [Nitrososphaeria archaeon]|nr:OB-fold domain-containing protein [Candidatus Bathyarchaeota archaeon]
MEPIITKFYELLSKGEIWGMKCKDCEGITFPPKTACSYCHSRNVEWYKLSGEGKVLYVSTSILPAKRFAEYSPYVYGLVQLKEGPFFATLINGIEPKPEALKAIFDKLPLDVTAEIKKMGGLDILTFKIKQE